MRSAILDVGSNSVHLDVLDLAPGGPVHLVTTVKRPTRLGESLTSDGRIAEPAVRRLTQAVSEALAVAREMDATELIAFATSAVRDAANRVTVVDAVAAGTGVELAFLSGGDEARLTFLAVRGWYGWSAGPLLLADLGGGSLEIAAGEASEPEFAISLPLGAGRLTRDHLPGDPPPKESVRELRAYIAENLEVGQFQEWLATAGNARVVATSRVFTQLAKLTRNGHDLSLRRRAMRKQVRRLAGETAAQRALLRGVSVSRAPQILAGAMVAEALLDSLDISRLEICPWALREGIALRRLGRLAVPGEQTDDIAHLLQPFPGQEDRLRAV